MSETGAETQTLGPCTECGTPHDACAAPDYCCDECLHVCPDWEGYTTTPDEVTAPVPAGPTDAQAELREEIARALRAKMQGARTRRSWVEIGIGGQSVWLGRADAVLALDTVRDALAAQEAVKRVGELHRPIDHEAYPAEDGEVAYCDADGYIWPCWTHRVLKGEPA